ncbi:hypothetical protein QEN19_001801 [Hanseniaspora menglaensis]
MNFSLGGSSRGGGLSTSSNSIIPSLIYDELTQNFDNLIVLDDDNILAREINSFYSSAQKEDIPYEKLNDDFDDNICKKILIEKILDYYSQGSPHTEGINFFIKSIKSFLVNRLYVTLDNKLITLVQINNIDELFESQGSNSSGLISELFEHCVERLANVQRHSTTLPLFIIDYTNNSMEKHEIVIALIKQIKNKLFINCILKIDDIDITLKKLFIDPHFDKIFNEYNQILQSKQSSFLKTNFSSFLSFASSSSQQEEKDINPQSMTLPEKYEMFNKFKKLAIFHIIRTNAKNFKESNKSLNQCLKDIDDSVILSKYNSMKKVREYHTRLTLMEKYNLLFENKLTVSDLYDILNAFPITYELLIFYIPMLETVCHDGRYTEDFIRIYEFILDKLNLKDVFILRGFIRDRITLAYEYKQYLRKINFNNLLSLREWSQSAENDKVKYVCETKLTFLKNCYNDDIFQNELNKYNFI